MDPVLLSDDIAADINKKILADTSWEEFAGIQKINFRILKILLSTGRKRPQSLITQHMIRTLRFKIWEKITPWSVRPEIQYSAWVLVKIKTLKQNNKLPWNYWIYLAKDWGVNNVMKLLDLPRKDWGVNNVSSKWLLWVGLFPMFTKCRARSSSSCV